jgi:hypothetical protein
MKKTSIIILQAVVLFIAIGVLAFMILEPQFEGRNIGASFFQIYFKDAFLAYAYIASIPFFVALWQAFKLLGLIGKGEAFTVKSINTLKTIRSCATYIIYFALGANFYLSFFVRGTDDITGGIFMGLLIILISGIVSMVTTVFEGILKEGMGEN